jgi:ATP-dependent helicase HrpB
MSPLPIDAVVPEVLARLSEAGAVVLQAPPGAGKTTRVPPALLPHPGTVLVVEPRRVAARAAARRMAAEHGSRLGEAFGYSVRFDTVAGPRTRVLVMTPGVLLRKLHADPFLEAVGTVVFDEFHERGVEADLALGLVRLLRQTVRPDLRAVIMSATLDAGPVADYLGGCPVVTSQGRTFPVDVRYRPGLSAADAVREALTLTAGDVLAFFPGVGEIRRAAAELGDLPATVLPLYGDLPADEQDRALRKLDGRKVVLATNVAETSVTVDGVTAVVDTGTARQQQFDPAVGMDRLLLGPVSRASADQRAGRAGRTAPGVCLRLWDELSHRARPAQAEPEVRRVDLAGPSLHLLAVGETLAGFPWPDPPRQEAVAAAEELLTQLGLTAGGGLTPLGRTVAGLPVHPRLGRMLVAAADLGVPDRAALAAALLSDRDPFDRSAPRPPARPTDSDVLGRVEALEAFARTGRTDGPLGTLHRGAAHQMLQAAGQYRRLLDGSGKSADPDADLLRAVFAGWPDRVARRRGPGDRRARMVGGRGVVLAPQSGVTDAELFVCVEVEAGGVESPVRQASAVRREWLTTTTAIAVTFDESAGKVVARKQTRFGDLVLDEVPAHFPDESVAAAVLAKAAAERLGEVLPPADSDAGRFLTRVRCLNGWLPDAGLPAFDDEFLTGLLEPLARGRRSLADLRAGPWLDVLRGSLTYPQLQLVEREAPDRLTVPSGSHIALAYEPGRPPVLAARIQELFGLAETPRVAAGRVKVLLHLLAPNYRPQQVTDDLASFWATGYPQVRKELRGRYPKHSWPDDPTTAEAVRGPKRRPTA